MTIQPTSVREVERRARKAADPVRAKGLQRFFKTAPGQYGAGDRFLGLTVPQIRTLARDCHGLPLGEIERLLESPWHELRALALVVLANQYARADSRQQSHIYRLYLRRTDRINNWDLVDSSAGPIVGAHLLDRSRAPLYRLARSKNLWERRIAMVATQVFIRRGQCDDALALAERLLEDRHDLMHKAVGWMLREVGKRDDAALKQFLTRHAARMPRTSLRYAIERFSPSERAAYLAIPRTRPVAR